MLGSYEQCVGEKVSMTVYTWVYPSGICVTYKSFRRSVVIPFGIEVPRNVEYERKVDVYKRLQGINILKMPNMKTDEIARRFGSSVTVSSRCSSSPRVIGDIQSRYHL